MFGIFIDKSERVFYNFIINKKKSHFDFKRYWRTYSRNDFSTYIYTNSCPERTRILNTAKRCDITVECYALLLLHILIEIVKQNQAFLLNIFNFIIVYRFYRGVAKRYNASHFDCDSFREFESHRPC